MTEDQAKTARANITFPATLEEALKDADYVIEAFRKSGNPADRPSPSMVEHYVKGEYGMKSGKGWYDYSKK